jgi:aminopeptidase
VDEPIESRAARNVGDILDHAIEHEPARAAIVVADGRCGLARLLAAAYRTALPEATHLDFDATAPEEILAAFAKRQAGDLVVLVQSQSFRLEAFRIRVDLFKRGLKVIEHPHLSRIADLEYDTYVDSLAYDPAYYRVVGHALKARIDRAAGAVLESGDARLVYDSPFEEAKLNIGDYATLKNVGGQFPIGEVFTEPRDLERVNGRVRIFLFGDNEFRTNAPAQLITLIIDGGRVTGVIDSTPHFDEVLAKIRADEELWVRELGFGMNRALTRTRRVSDVGTYERMCGVHLSLGAKHGVYNKALVKRKTAKYHVDVFPATEQLLLDGEVVFAESPDASDPADRRPSPWRI